MAGSWRHRGEPPALLLKAVVAYLQLLEAEWEYLDDAQRRRCIRLALEAADVAPRSAEGDAAHPASHTAGGIAGRITQGKPDRPNA